MEAYREGNLEPSSFSEWRDSVAHWLIMRKEVLLGLLFAFSASAVVLSFCSRFPVPEIQISQFIPLLGVVAVFVLAFIRMRISLLVAVLTMSIEAFLYAPALGVCVFAVGFSICVLSIFSPLAALLVFSAPLLAGPLGIPLIVPLLFGFTLGKQRGTIWTFFAFLVVFLTGVFLGDERMGLPGYGGELAEVHSRWSPLMVQGGVGAIFRNLVIDFGPFTVALESAQAYAVRFSSHFLLWLATAFTVGAVYRRRKFVDQLAVEYLKKAKVETEVKEATYRGMPMAIAAGTVLFVLGSIVIKLAVEEGAPIEYHPDQQAMLDILSGAVLAGLLVFRFQGDPRHTERIEAEARARRAKRRRAEKANGKGSVTRKSSIIVPGGTGEFRPSSKGGARIPTRSSQGEIPPGGGSRPGGRKVGPRSDFRIPRPKSADVGTSDWKPSGGDADSAVSQAAFQPNEKIDGQYSINKIRSGGMGVVYIVTDDFSGKRYAVKSLKDELISDGDAMERFAVEAKTWINLDHHENIVQAMLYRVVNGRPLLFLEYVEGTDLEHLLHMRQDYAIAQILNWAVQICRGMAYAHNKRFQSGRVGIIHRDLKPANVMVTREGVAKITDFGLAKVVDTATGLTQQNTGLGTLSYMPPEQLEDARSVDKRADIYSFGALVYELITGQPPFTADSARALAMSVMSQAPSPPSTIRTDCPRELDRLVLKCLEKSPENRYGSFEEIDQDLQALCSAEGQAEPMGSAAQPSPGRSPTPFPTATPTPAPGSGVLTGRASSLIEAITFIDMVASTAKGSKYGDNLVMQLKNELAQIVETETKRQKRAYIKGTGDGYMITFPDSENAVRAACNILRRVNERNENAPHFRRIDLRMGIHFGEVQLDSQSDRQGSAVNMASRIENVTPTEFHQTRMGVRLEDLREENRIFISEVVNEEIGAAKVGFKTRLVGYFDLKGFPGRHRIYEVQWK